MDETMSPVRRHSLNGGRRGWTALVIVMIAIIGHGSSAVCQVAQETANPRTSYHPLDQKTYDQVLDLVFPAMPPVTKDIIFAIRIRYTPSFEPESQVLITFFQDKPSSVDYVEALKSIYWAGDDVARRGDAPDPIAIAKSVSVRRDVREISGDAAIRWQQAMIEKLDGTLLHLPDETEKLYKRETIEITLDGTGYEISYAQRGVYFRSRFEQTPTGSAIAKWAEDLRMEIVEGKSK